MIEEHKDLLDFEELVNAESASLPKGFSLLVTLKQELSRRYITMASILMKRRMYRTAEQLVERSEAITQSLNDVVL